MSVAAAEVTAGPPAHRETDLPWLGSIPSHWRVMRLRWTIRSLRNGTWGTEPDGENDIICVRVADFDRVGLSVCLDQPTFRAVTLNERTGRILRRGDLLLEKSGGGELQPVGAVVQFNSDEPAVCSNFVAGVAIADDCDSRFLTYLHAHLYDGRVNTRSIKQTTGIQNLDSYSYLCEVVGIPPLKEQRAIATYLDRETARIDALISRKQRLIELLQEKRTALISHVVTRGLDASAPTKPSGYDWLGAVPVHWAVKPLKYIVDQYGPGIQMGPFGTSLKELQFSDTGFKVYGQENTISGDFDAGQRWLTRAQFEELRKYELRSGDIVLTRKGSIGQCRMVPNGIRRGIADSDTIRVRLDRRLMLSRLLVNSLHEAWYLQAQMHSVRRGAILGGLNTATIANLCIVVPPVHEQETMLNHLDATFQTHTNLTTAIAAAIAALREYRSALISAAVTGKFDVRNTEAPM